MRGKEDKPACNSNSNPSGNTSLSDETTCAVGVDPIETMTFRPDSFLDKNFDALTTPSTSSLRTLAAASLVRHA
jgi:hypothetical protein